MRSKCVADWIDKRRSPGSTYKWAHAGLCLETSSSAISRLQQNHALQDEHEAMMVCLTDELPRVELCGLFVKKNNYK